MYVPRQDGQTNGIVTRYRVELSSNGTEYTPVSSGNLPSNNKAKTIEFDKTKAHYVKFVSEEGMGEFSSAAEFYVYKATVVTRQANKDALIARYNELKDVKIGKYTLETYEIFSELLEMVAETIDAEDATQAEVDGMLQELNDAYAALKEREEIEKQENGVKAKFLSGTFESDDVTLTVEKKQGNNIRDSYEIAFTKDGNKVQPAENQEVEVTLPRKADQEVVKIEHNHEGTIEAITDFTLGEGTITFNTSKFSGFTIVYRPPVLSLAQLDTEVAKFNGLVADEYESGYAELKAKLDEINTKLQYATNPLNQAELDALVAELQPLFTALVKKVEKPNVQPSQPDETVKPLDATKPSETIKSSDTNKANVETGDNTNVFVNIAVLLVSAIAILGLRKKLK